MVWENGCFILLGIAFIGVGLKFRLGSLRAYYWLQPFSYYRSGIYGLLPFGMALLLVVIVPLFGKTIWGGLVLGLIVVFVLLGLYMWLLEPNFARPDWVNWLEDNHWEILPLLRREVIEMSAKSWREQVQTQADLEAWVAEVRQKHGM